MQIRAALSLVAVLFFLGCEETPQVPSIDEVTRAVEEKVDDLSNTIKSKATSTDDLKYLSEGDLEKLFRVEYIVEEHPIDLSGGELQARLNTLGLERWQCFITYPPSPPKIRFLCHRPPLGLVRLMSRVVPFLF